MADFWQQRRPRLAHPFTVVIEANTVRLIAGEDFRYTLTAPHLERWLPTLLQRFNGKQTLGELWNDLPPEQRDAAQQLVERLYGERVLVDGSASDAHRARTYRVIFEGCPSLFLMLTECEANAPPLVVFCQDYLDYETVLGCHRRCRAAKTPMIWMCTGALTRGFVSPLFLPDAGPCFGCLLGSFQRLSPAPEIYEALRAHSRQGKAVAAVDFPAEGLLVLQGVLRWKLGQAELAEPDPALFRLHVLEREHFEVASHRVFIDAFCPECGRGER